MERLGQDMQLIQQQLEADEAVVAKIRDRLGQGETQSRYEVDTLVERLMAQYERTTYQIKSEFREGLSLFTLAKRSFFSMFNRQQRIETWIEELKQRAQNDLEASLDTTSKEGAKRFLDGIQLLIKELLAELTLLQNNSLRQTEVSLPLLEYRYEVIEGVKAKVVDLLNDKTFINSLADNAESVGPGVASGSIIAVISGIVVRVASLFIIDVIATAFLGLGVLWAGGTLVSKRRSLIKKLETELDRNRDTFEFTVSQQLNDRLQGIYDEISVSFGELYKYVDQERANIAPLAEQFDQVQQTTQSLSTEIRQL